MNKTLGLSIILKNEKENITKNLLSFYKSFFNVVVIDTGSTDGTLEFLELNNIQSIPYALNSNDPYSIINARNYSISSNSTDYILVLDADEFISLENIEGIKRIINTKDCMDGYFIKFMDFRYGEPFEDYKLCLFKKNIFFDGCIHENTQSFFRRHNLGATLLQGIEIHHKPTSFSQTKIERYITQMESGIQREHNNTRYLWFLGYSFYKLNNAERAVKYLSRALETFSEFYPVETINAGIVLSYIYYLKGNKIKSLESIEMTILFFNKLKNDLEVKINFRMEKTLYRIKTSLLNNKKIDFIYEFMF